MNQAAVRKNSRLISPFLFVTRSDVPLQVLDQGGNLGDHVLHILKHGALGGAHAAGGVNMYHNLLVLVFDSVEELAQGLQLLL